MQKDYKMFPPSVDWDNINWSSRRPLMDFPVQVEGFRMRFVVFKQSNILILRVLFAGSV